MFPSAVTKLFKAWNSISRVYATIFFDLFTNLKKAICFLIFLQKLCIKAFQVRFNSYKVESTGFGQHLNTRKSLKLKCPKKYCPNMEFPKRALTEDGITKKIMSEIGIFQFKEK